MIGRMHHTRLVIIIKRYSINLRMKSNVTLMEKRVKATTSFLYVFNWCFFVMATIDFPLKYVHIGNSRQICMHEGRQRHSTLLELRSRDPRC